MKLHTGKEIPDTIAVTYSFSLDRVRRAGMIGVLALADLREKAENRKHEIFDPRGEKLLKDAGFLDHAGNMPQVARDYILAVVKKHGDDIDIVNPLTGR